MRQILVLGLTIRNTVAALATIFSCEFTPPSRCFHEMDPSSIPMPPTPRRSCLRLTLSACWLLLLAAGLWIGGLFAAMNGGALGLFMMTSSTVLLLGALGFSIAAWRRKKHLHQRNPIALSILTILLGGIIFLHAAVTIHCQITNPISLLCRNPPGKSYARTRIIGQFGSATVTVLDPENLIRYRFGPPPTSVTVEGDTRVITFSNNPVILKSLHGDFGFEPPSVETGGWMGASLPLETSTLLFDPKDHCLQPTESTISPTANL